MKCENVPFPGVHIHKNGCIEENMTCTHLGPTDIMYTIPFYVFFFFFLSLAKVQHQGKFWIDGNGPKHIFLMFLHFSKNMSLKP